MSGKCYKHFPSESRIKSLNLNFHAKLPWQLRLLKIKSHTICTERFALLFWGSIIGVDAWNSKQINKYLHFYHNKCFSVLYMRFLHPGLLYINLMLFTISVSECTHCIQWLKDMSAVKIRFVTRLYCQHNIPGEGKWHFNGDLPRRISTPCSDIWQWGIEASLWDDCISVSPSPNSVFTISIFFCPVTVEQRVRWLLNYTIIPLLWPWSCMV